VFSALILLFGNRKGIQPWHATCQKAFPSNCYRLPGETVGQPSLTHVYHVILGSLVRAEVDSVECVFLSVCGCREHLLDVHNCSICRSGAYVNHCNRFKSKSAFTLLLEQQSACGETACFSGDCWMAFKLLMSLSCLSTILRGPLLLSKWLDFWGSSQACDDHGNDQLNGNST